MTRLDALAALAVRHLAAVLTRREHAAHAAYCCLVCGKPPAWRLLRRGDTVVTWADDAHLAYALRDLRRRPHLPDEGVVVTEFRPASARSSEPS